MGYKPPNQVIKLTGMDAGFGFTDVVKLSDSGNKHIGTAKALADVMRAIRLD